MKGTRTDLRKWFLAIYLLATTKKPLSSAELARQLGIAAVTAWTMRRKIMHAMSRREGELMLVGVVEMDESYVGGTRSGIRGRGAEGKTPVAVMAQQNESGGCSLAHIQVIDDISGLSLGDAATGYVTPGSVVATDCLPAYGKLAGLGFPWSWEEPTPASCFPGCISSSPISSAGSLMPFTASVPNIFSPISMSSATGSTGANREPISFAAS